jgi:signal transduction histidine kinase/ActR/RegA family two-component response regulator
LDEDAGVALLAEEALVGADPKPLLDWVAHQPPWSDLPFIILLAGREASYRNSRLPSVIAEIQNATLLERPLHSATLLSAIRSGLRARSRQYQMRRHLRELERAAREVRALNETLEARVAERTSALEDANRRLVVEVDERKRIGDALRQAQKMQAVGELTGGLAHDFNNMLTVIGANLELLQLKLKDQPELRRMLSSAARGVERAAHLTHQLLAFSRKQRLEPRPTNINAVVAGMTDLLRRTLGETIELQTQLAPDLEFAYVDANQVETVLLNLVLNARDASAGHGHVVISTRNAVLAHGNGSAAGGRERYIELCVSDSGCGMPPEVLARVFEPFFTTKEVGKGSGLGLSMVYGFVQQSNGHIKIDSEVGRGTAIRIFLPLADAKAALEPMRTAMTPAIDDSVQGGQRVLVVEDDDGVRDVATAVLAQFGYTVLQASDATAALNIIAADPTIDLVFTDMVMPGPMSGMDLAHALAERWPRVAVLLTSGYAERLATARLPPGVAFLRKPYRPADVVAAIRALLARGADPSRATARPFSEAAGPRA